MKRQEDTLRTLGQATLTFRDRKPASPPPIEKQPGDDDDGPSRPKVERPDTRELLKRMRRVDPNQSRRYRQRTGE